MVKFRRILSYKLLWQVTKQQSKRGLDTHKVNLQGNPEISQATIWPEQP